MSIRLTLRDTEQWVEVKDVWSRRDLRQFTSLLQGDETPALQLLGEWSNACHLVDLDGVVYEQVGALTPEALDAFDVAVVRFLYNVPSAAHLERAQLGNAISGPSSVTPKA